MEYGADATMESQGQTPLKIMETRPFKKGTNQAIIDILKQKFEVKKVEGKKKASEKPIRKESETVKKHPERGLKRTTAMYEKLGEREHVPVYKKEEKSTEEENVED
jgi:hypothetical protein